MSMRSRSIPAVPPQREHGSIPSPTIVFECDLMLTDPDRAAASHLPHNGGEASDAAFSAG
jgi:hypothetical protein